MRKFNRMEETRAIDIIENTKSFEDFKLYARDYDDLYLIENGKAILIKKEIKKDGR